MFMNGVRDGAKESVGSSMVCPVCEAALLHRQHCKTVCERCGYVESCEDNFVPHGDNPIEHGETVPA